MVLQTMLKMILLVRSNQSKQFFKKPIISCGRQLLVSYFCKLNFRFVFTSTNTLAVCKSNTDKTGFNSKKAAIISSLHFKSAEDAAPFYALRTNTLYEIQKTTLSDRRYGFCENRLYYISSRIQCPPAVLSEKLAKRNFVYKLPFKWLESSLNELLEKGVSGERILRDLWVLKYNHKTIRDRLQRIKDSGIVHLLPWMVRCSPDILNRYLKFTQETKTILGNSDSTQVYLANRLNISIEEVEKICVKMPALKSIRATKVKHFLDFLINEGFTIEEIAKKPRILAYSQETAKQRLKELRQLGVTDINLNLLCRTKKDFKRVFKSLETGLKDCKYNDTKLSYFIIANNSLNSILICRNKQYYIEMVIEGLFNQGCDKIEMLRCDQLPVKL